MPNEYANKVQVVRGGQTETLIDLTADTVTASTLMLGYTAHDASGAAIVGTSTAGTMVIRDTQDSHGGTVREITAGSVVQGTKTITENGTYDVAEFADASVNVPAPEPELQAKTATPSTSQQVITADSGYDGLSQVTVSAMPSGSATTPTTSITANPSISVNSSTGLITASVSGSKSVTPSVSAGYVSSGTAGTVSVSGSNTSQLTTQAAKTVTPSTSSQTAVAAGRYTTGAVTVAAMPSGTAGTPTATKGTVSNHSVSVTPSVTNTTGYITGGTKTGTAVSVSASELVSGTLSITGSGTKDVTNYASASVAEGGATASATKGTVSNHSIAVTPSVTRTAGYVTAGTTSGTTVTVSASELVSGTLSITENGTADVTNYASVDVDVAGSSTAYTATISGTGDLSVCYVQVNRTGDMYYADGTTFTFTDTDEIFFRCAGSRAGGTITLNGTVVAHDNDGTVTYTLASPRTDMTISIAYSITGAIDVAVPELPITENGKYSVAQYAIANVNVTIVDDFTADFANTIMRSGNITKLPSNITTIGQYAFRECSGLALTSLPSGITSIGNYSFYACKNIVLTSLPSGVTSIGQYAFCQCSGLTSISSEARLTSLGSYAFTGLSSNPMALTSARFPNMALTSNIGTVFGSTTAANACQLLETCDIGSTTGIGSNSFANCYRLQTLVLRKTASVCTLSNVSAFLNTPMRGYDGLTGTVYVPSALISSYQTATNWSTLYNDGTVTFAAIEGSEWEL